MTISTPSNTCPECGVVGLGYVCGSPADPSGGLDCYRRALAAGHSLTVAVLGESELGCCTTILPDGTFVVEFDPDDRAGWTQYVTQRDLVEVEVA